MDPFHHLNSSFSNPYHPLLASSPPHHFAPDPLRPPPPPPPPLPADPAPTSLERERLPQWSHAETAAFLTIRANLDHAFLSTKRNKALWEAASARLHALGFARTPDQCKSKWKNLVTRFKGTEAVVAQPDPQATAAARGSFPFHDELRRIFDARVERAHALERKKAKGKDPDDQDDGGGGGGVEGDEEDEEEEQVDDDDDDRASGETMRSGSKKRRRQKAAATRRSGLEGEVESMLREFMRRQLEMEERWLEAAEAREAERRAREEEWRAAMVALGEERLALVRRWREREDAWRARAEEREEHRHQLVAALLAKLGAGDAS
ncbi:hypothetical protein GUJ93_ZPchr0010g7996 [Zizania palustris]|uniref:Myb-like domain-containing protein n=1 Tax=Zizania palustris TaxID=103762 RepID=A0A8J5W8K2_ZIZPA|nr:hypothetical protein GUJ93_ZPchr0010g7996 [Zizania palustris]